MLHRWVAGMKKPDSGLPEKLIYPLQHAYTPAELSFTALKGADAAAAAVLKGAARHSGCDLHLALISIEESGIADITATTDRDGGGVPAMPMSSRLSKFATGAPVFPTGYDLTAPPHR